MSTEVIERWEICHQCNKEFDVYGEGKIFQGYALCGGCY
jgi:hypothetical protein